MSRLWVKLMGIWTRDAVLSIWSKNGGSHPRIVSVPPRSAPASWADDASERLEEFHQVAPLLARQRGAVVVPGVGLPGLARVEDVWPLVGVAHLRLVVHARTPAKALRARGGRG